MKLALTTFLAIACVIPAVSLDASGQGITGIIIHDDDGRHRRPPHRRPPRLAPIGIEKHHVDVVIEAGVATVIYAHGDPNPKTAGDGPARLREAGIEVKKGRASVAVKEQIRPYLEHLERKRPWVIAKWAMTLDGRIATRSGDSEWISSPVARQFAHRNFRGRVDAIVVGAGLYTLIRERRIARQDLAGEPRAP